jgi:two-component system KDP operon response regulator KdpE
MPDSAMPVASGALPGTHDPARSPGPATLLFIGYDRHLHSFVRQSLNAEKYLFLQAGTGAEGLHVAAEKLPDVVLLEIALRDIDAIMVIRGLREYSAVPIIVLSGRRQTEDKIKTLDAGANDFLDRPFDMGELMARLRVALRPRNGGELAQPAFRNGPLEVDVHRRLVRVNAASVSLTPREFNLLLQFVRHPGRVLTHQQLLFKAWGPAHVTQVQYLRVYIRYLRQKLGIAGALIETQPGVGYCMVQMDGRFRGPSS